MERPRALRSPGAALVRPAIARVAIARVAIIRVAINRVAIIRVAIIAIALAAGPGASALGVARSMRFRARPYLLAPANASAVGLPAGRVPAAAHGAAGSTRRASAAGPASYALFVPPSAIPEAVLQSDARSCGPAALATVLAWEGRPLGESAVLARTRRQADGVTLAELARLAAAFDLPGSWYAVPARDLARLPTPFLAHLRTGGGHYVAVARVARGFVLLADPALGIELMRSSRFRRAWSGRVLLFRTVRDRSAR